MKVQISLACDKPSADTVRRLILAATSNCRCAKFVECDRANPRPGCMRAERAAKPKLLPHQKAIINAVKRKPKAVISMPKRAGK